VHAAAMSLVPPCLLISTDDATNPYS